MRKIFGILLIALLSLQAQSKIISEEKKFLVPEPSGNETIDRNLILKALDKANIGDTIQFSSGVYQIGKKLQIKTNGVILKGNSKGTVIRGCDPESFTEPVYGLLNCGGLELIGQNQTIENLIFEYAWHGLMIGCCLPESVEELESGSNIKTEQLGGHKILNNTFRYNSTGIRVIGINPSAVVISKNVFQDNYHGLTINGSNVKVDNNKFYTSNPDKIPIDASIDNAIGIFPFSSMFPSDNRPELKNDCSKIVVVGNTIENIKKDIRIVDSIRCEDIVIRENIIKE